MNRARPAARARRMPLRACVLAIVATFGFGATADAGAAAMRLADATVRDGGVAPNDVVYAGRGGSDCRGANRSPALAWEYVPPGTASLAIVTYDVDAKFTHWGLYDVSPDRRGVPAGAGVAADRFGRTIVNNFGHARYDGPCPPPGTTHRYVTTLYALDAVISLPPRADGAALRAALRPHTIVTARVSFTYRT